MARPAQLTFPIQLGLQSGLQLGPRGWSKPLIWARSLGVISEPWTYLQCGDVRQAARHRQHPGIPQEAAREQQLPQRRPSDRAVRRHRTLLKSKAKFADWLKMNGTFADWLKMKAK
jgi:hypothetical protein